MTPNGSRQAPYTDPWTCPIAGGFFRFETPAELRVYLDRIAAERMRGVARHLAEVGAGSELAKAIKKQHGQAFLDELLELAHKAEAAA